MHKGRATRGSDGFTLVEMLIVVVILGILGGLVVLAVGNSTRDAAQQSCKTEARQFVNAFAAYQVDHHGTPVGGTTTADMATNLHTAGALTGASLTYLDPAQGGAVASASSSRWTFDATSHVTDTANC